MLDKSERKKRKAKESFYACEEEWNSQKKRAPKKSNYLKDKVIDFDFTFGSPQTTVQSIRVTGAKKPLGGSRKDSGNLAPMAINLGQEDITMIETRHEYISSDAVDAGLCMLDRKLNEESSLNVTVYSTQNLRLIFTGERQLIQPGKFIAMWHSIDF